ncbi:S-layer homology domain-containing protein [Paenibacillus xylaniclasticus]|uniref:S-layer homology domain-containing protein n=1 Tax=Paenibacillus xylaniclasticus TaxID=588083 RepID=UPI0013DEDB06|nr:S-layer homology domain-containing protein [Paenibacillus xylaniclasticus]
MKQLARWLLAVMLIAVVQPLLVAPKVYAATPDATITTVEDKSYDAGGYYPTGAGSNEHLAGYSWYAGVNYGDSYYVMKYKIDSSKFDTSRTIEKAELVLNIVAKEFQPNIPSALRKLRIYTSTDTSWLETNAARVDPATLVLAREYNADEIAKDTNTLDVTAAFNAYRAAHPSATEITFVLEGTTEAELLANNVAITSADFSAYFVISDRLSASGNAPHLDLTYSANTAPTGISLDTSTVLENSPVGTVVGTLSADDAEGGTMAYSMAPGGVDNSSFQISGNQLKTAASFDYETKNSYSIKVQVADSGNLTYTQDFTISVENVNEAPTGSIIINGGQTATNSQDVTLTLTGSDPENDPLMMSFNADGGPWTTPVVFGTSATYTLPAVEGTRTINFKVTDSQGLSHTSSSTIILDKTAPTGTLSINNGASVTSSTSVTLGITASDSLSPSVEMRLSNDGSTWSAWEPAAASMLWTLASGDGNKTVRLQLRDIAGNTVEITDSIVLDTVPPNGVLAIAGGANYTNSATVNLNLANPDGTAIEMRFQNESGAWSSWETYASTKSGWLLSSGDGVKTVNAQLKDTAGNTVEISDTITLDTIPPVVTGIADGDVKNTDVTITFDGSGTLNGNSFSSGTSVTAEGTYTLVAVDAAGNMTTVHFTIDKTAPDGSVVINGGAAETNDTTVTLTISNPDGTAEQVRFSNDGSTWSTWEAYTATKSWTLAAGDGTKTVSVQLKDAAGNAVVVSDNITLDTTEPDGAVTINGGAANTNDTVVSLAISNPDGTAKQMRFSNDGSTWSAWEAYGATKSWTLAVGDGTKTVSVQLQDAAGNVKTVSDTINLDTTAPVITGVTDGGLYNADLTITYNEGSGDLNGAPFSSGSQVTAEGTYTLTVTDATGNAAVVTFTLDKTAPTGTITINGGASDTNSLTAELTLTSDGTADQMRFSNDGSTWSSWEAYGATKSWTLAAGDGTKTVSAQLKDAAGNARTVSDTINLDTVAPVVTGVTDSGLYNTDLTITYNEGSGVLDGAPFSSGSQVTAEGTHTLKVTDAAGNVTTVTFTLDRTEPDGTVTINGGAAATNDTTVSLAISNPDGTAKQMRFSNDGSTWSAWETFAATRSWTIAAGEGTKTVSAQLKDAAGNIRTVSDTITLDTTAPTGTITINGGASDTNSLTAALTLTSDGTADQMRFSNDGSTWSAWEAYGAAKSWTLAAGDGTKTVSVQLKDAAGNVHTASDTINLDTAAPVVTGVTDGGLYNTDLTITYNEGSGVLDGAPFSSGSQVTAEGTHTLKVTDAAGNVTTVTFTLDKTAPDGTVAINGGAVATNDTTVSLAISNPDGTAKQMRFSNDGSTWSAWEAYGAAKSWTLTTGDGTKTVSVQLQDAAGNVQNMSDSIDLDTVAPVITGVTDGGLYNTDLTITYNEGSGDLNGVPFSSGSQVAAEGTHTLKVTDAAGNTTTVTFTLDKTAPDGTVTINGGAAATNDTAVSLAISNPDGTADQMRFSNDGSTWSAWEAFAATKSWTLTAGEGTKTVSVQLVDVAGNVGTMSSTIEMDTTPPTGSVSINGGAPITTSSNVVVTVSASGAAQMSYSIDNGATWSAWTAYVPTLSVQLPNGYGTKTVLIKLKDAAGNESTPLSGSIILRSVPVLNNNEANGTEDTPYAFKASDFALTNEDGTALSTIEIVSLPAHGSLQLGGAAVKAGDKLSAGDATALSFIPEADWNGQTSLTWKGEFSGVASSSTAVLTLTIAAVNDAPIAQNASYTTTDEAEVKAKLISTDIDGDTLTYSIVDQPLSGQLTLDEASGAFTYKPKQAGTFTFTYRTFDGTVFSNTAEVTIKHSYTPSSPVSVPVNPSTSAERLATINGDEKSPLNDNLQIEASETKSGSTIAVTVSGDKWKGEFPGKPGESVRIVIVSSAYAGSVTLDSSMVDRLSSGSRGVAVELGDRAISIPADMLSQLAEAMKISTAVLRIEITKATEADAETANKAASRSGARIVAAPMQYRVYVEADGKRTELSSFNGYLDIYYKSEELQGANPTTAALIGNNSKLRPLPTKFDRTSSSTYIRVHGLTYGTFVLVEADAAFHDTKGHWAEGSIDTLADRLIINGVGNGRFEPNRTATRAEFASILVQAFGLYGRSQALNYSDTTAGLWYEEALEFASGYGLITGYADGSFRPNATITREEAMVIMARTAKLLGLDSDLTKQQAADALNPFGDQDALHDWSRESAVLCVALGIVNGIDGDLKPEQPITRAQLVVMIENLLNKADYI